MLSIPPPTLPPMEDPMLYGIAGGCIVTGAVLVLAGQKLSRIIMALAAAGGGLLGGMALSGPMSLPLWAVGGVGALTGLILGVILSRLLWALLAAGICAASALLALLAINADTVQLAPTVRGDESLPQYALAAGDYLFRAILELWESKRMTVAIAGAAPMAIMLLAGVMAPRFVQVVFSALVGAVIAAGGIVLGISKVKPQILESLWTYWYVAAGVVGLLWLLGLFSQGRMALADKKKKPKDADKAKPATKKPEDK